MRKWVLVVTACVIPTGLLGQTPGATVTVDVPPAEVRIVHADTTLVFVHQDSASMAAFDDAVQALHASIEAEAAPSGTDWYGVAKDVAWVGLAIWGIIEFRKYRKHRTQVNVDVDVDVEGGAPGTDGTDGLDGQDPTVPPTPDHWVPPGHRKDKPGKRRGQRGGEE